MEQRGKVPKRGNRRTAAAGTFSIQLLVLLVPVFFGLMGFAVDLGRLYLIRGELNQAASAMALSAASQLIGTSTATDNATAAANQLLDDSTNHGARYNFGANLIGQTTGLLSSTVTDPLYYASMSDFNGTGNSSNLADGTTARHAQVNLTADAPLLFWGLLALGQSRSTPIGATATAGISSPVCVACGIEPFAVATQDTSLADTVDFGFIYGSYYTFVYQCTVSAPNNPAPTPLPGTTGNVSYVLIDHFDPNNTTQDETDQLYSAGAAGLLGASPSNINAAPAGGPVSCVSINSTETVWGANALGNTSAAPGLCGNNIPAPVQQLLCGLYSRMDTSLSPPDACTAAVVDAGTIAASLTFDTDINDPGGDYTAYAGNGRRVITVPIVDGLGTLTVLGFRQFLLIPPTDGTGNLNPADVSGRFIAMYMGMSPADTNTTPAPIRQGAISCPSATGTPGFTIQGPGKVVLHQ